MNATTATSQPTISGHSVSVGPALTRMPHDVNTVAVKADRQCGTPTVSVWPLRLFTHAMHPVKNMPLPRTANTKATTGDIHRDIGAELTPLSRGAVPG